MIPRGDDRHVELGSLCLVRPVVSSLQEACLTRAWMLFAIALSTLVVPVAAAHGQDRCQQALRSGRR